ncbi:type II CAAX endopeptidase family protein [Streptomyces sp. NPDC046862]|uniref:CPBP family intramembrane glutamic endopeptidase n=1 Tax=Streptomyces sp. NPDC046862 TaxID=3154603 RepID=UPI003451C9C9
MSTQAPVSTGTGPATEGGDVRENRTTGLRGGIRRRPVTWFFSLAFLLSWAAWTPYILSGNGLGLWHFTFPGGAGGSQLLGVLPGAYLGPIASALLVTGVTEGRAGLRAWRSRMTKFRVNWRWYAVVLVSVPAALIMASTALGDREPAMPPAMVLAAYLPGLLIQLVTTGLAEEPGWREFAMPRLQQRYGPLAATVIVGPLWGVWHLPLFLTEWGGYPDVTGTHVLKFVVTAIGFSFVMTWVFNRSGGSMPLVMLLHCGVNNYFSIAAADMFPWLSREATSNAFLLSATTGALILLVATRGRLGCSASV